MRNSEKIIKQLHEEIEKLKTQVEAAKVKDDTNIGLLISDIITMRDTGDLVNLKLAASRLVDALHIDRDVNTSPNLAQDLVDYSNQIREYYLPNNFGIDISVRAGTMFLVGAGVGVGKSTWLANYLYDCIETGKRCILFSLEMTSYDFWIKLFQIHLYIKTGMRFDYMTMLQTIKNKKFSEVLESYIDYASDRAWIVDATKFTATDIVGYMELSRTKWDDLDPQFTFIDYAQLIRPETYTIGKDKRHQVDESIKILVNKAKATGSVMMIASQLSRQAQNENFESTTAFKEASALEEDAALAILLKREKNETGEHQPCINVSVVKNRYGRITKKQIMLIPEVGYLYK